jgi:glycosyltransferase involved in cell wall biosynthesis
MLTAVVLTRNEEKNLSRCLSSLRFCDSLVVIDDGSTDGTLVLARKFKARIISHLLNGDFSAQRNFALTQIKSSWILFVDADEEVSPALAEEITSAVNNPDYKAFYLKRVDHLWHQTLTHGDLSDVRILRLARGGAGTWVGRVHEIWQVEGNIGILKSPLLHYPHPEFTQFIKEIDVYSTIRADELYGQGTRGNVLQIIFYPVAKFINLYFFRLGLLDGTAGFVHAMTMSLNTFLIRSKLFLLGKNIS